MKRISIAIITPIHGCVLYCGQFIRVWRELPESIFWWPGSLSLRVEWCMDRKCCHMYLPERMQSDRWHITASLSDGIWNIQTCVISQQVYLIFEICKQSSFHSVFIWRHLKYTNMRNITAGLFDIWNIQTYAYPSWYIWRHLKYTNRRHYHSVFIWRHLKYTNRRHYTACLFDILNKQTCVISQRVNLTFEIYKHA